MGPMDQSWIRVMTPAASMAFWSRVTYRAGSLAVMLGASALLDLLPVLLEAGLVLLASLPAEQAAILHSMHRARTQATIFLTFIVLSSLMFYPSGQ